MMDEFYEYWELIPEFDKYEIVGKVNADKVPVRFGVFDSEPS